MVIGPSAISQATHSRYQQPPQHSMSNLQHDNNVNSGVPQTSKDVVALDNSEQSLVSTKEKSTPEKVINTVNRTLKIGCC